MLNLKKILSAVISTDVLLVLFLLTSFLPFRHILNFSTANQFGWFSELLTISIYFADIAFVLLFIIHINQFKFPLFQKLPLVLFSIMYFIFEAYRNHSHGLGVYGLLRMAQFFLILYLLTRLFRQSNTRTLVCAVIFGIGLFQSALGTYQVTTGHSLGLRFLGEQTISISASGVAKVDLGADHRLLRAYGTMPHPNILGGFLVLAVCASIFIYSRFVKHRFLLGLSMMFLMIGLLLTFSRSAIISLFILWIVYLWINRPELSLKRGKFLLITVMILVTIFSLITPFRQALWRRVTPTINDKFIEERTLLNHNATKIFFSDPYFGVGLGNYFFALLKIAPLGSGLNYWQYDYPHNVPLELLTELGIYGVIFISIAVYYILRNQYTMKYILIAVIILTPLLMFDHYLITNQAGRIMLALFLTLIPYVFAADHKSTENSIQSKN